MEPRESEDETEEQEPEPQAHHVNQSEPGGQDTQDADDEVVDAGDAADEGSGPTDAEALNEVPAPVKTAADGEFVKPPTSALGVDDGSRRRQDDEPREGVPEKVRKYDRFKKVDRAEYDRVNDFIRKRTYITAREWAIARLCSDFRTETGVEMTLIGENLPRLVPFMEDTYTPQAVNQARSAFEDKVRMSGSTFLYGAMSGFFTTEELDEMMYEVSETARFLLEVEGVEIGVDHETEVQDRISSAMRDIRESSRELRGEEDDETHRCPECGHEF